MALSVGYRLSRGRYLTYWPWTADLLIRDAFVAWHMAIYSRYFVGDLFQMNQIHSGFSGGALIDCKIHAILYAISIFHHD